VCSVGRGVAWRAAAAPPVMSASLVHHTLRTSIELGKGKQVLYRVGPRLQAHLEAWFKANGWHVARAHVSHSAVSSLSLSLPPSPLAPPPHPLFLSLDS
jgi:hypothetical protein